MIKKENRVVITQVADKNMRAYKDADTVVQCKTQTRH